MPEHKVKYVDVIARDNTEYNNYLILYTLDLWTPNLIDYSRTIFRHEILNEKDWEIMELYEVASMVAYEEKLKELKAEHKGLVNRMIFEKAFLSKGFSLDFFRIANGYLGMNVISEKIKNSFETEGITGLLYEEIDWLYNYD